MDVAFCVDRGALIGLHVALHTMLQNASTALTVHLVHDGLTADDVAAVQRTIHQAAPSAEVRWYPFDPGRFRRLRWLGGWMPYTRILLPEILDCSRVVYLDADLLIYADVAELADADLVDAPLGAASWGEVGNSQDGPFFRRIGRDPSRPYFNSGVLVMDLDRWRARGLSDECLRVAQQFGRDLPTADQTVLNYVLGPDVAAIPRRYNTPVSADRERLSDEAVANRVIHLVGRPKPWDPAGRWLNGQGARFHRELAHTAIAGDPPRQPSSVAVARRSLRFGKAYCKSVSARIRRRDLLSV